MTVSFLERFSDGNRMKSKTHPPAKNTSQEPTRGCRMYGVECINHHKSFELKLYFESCILVPLYLRSLFDARTSTSLNPYHLYNDKPGVGIIRSSQPVCLRICVKRKARLFSRCTLPKTNMNLKMPGKGKPSTNQPIFSFHLRNFGRV